MLSKTKLMLFSFCLLTFVLGSTSAAVAQISTEERQALIMLYQHTGGEQWKINSGWRTPPLDGDGFAMPGTEDSWYGVTCDRSNTKVVALQLRQAGLEGEGIDYLASLVHLRTLDLSDNRLSGQEFGFLSHLTQLRNLHLHQNAFRGNIMPALAPLANLRRLNLSENQFTAWDPSNLHLLSNLTYLNLSRNSIDGFATWGLSNLPKLTHLDLSRNRFSGDIFIPLGSLKYVDLSDNQLEWSTCDLNGAERLEHLDFSNNRYIGFSASGSAVPKLRYLDLSNTDLLAPPVMGRMNAIETIKLQNCRVSDFDLNSMSTLATLRHLDLSHNRLGHQGYNNPPALNSWPALEYLDISHNQIGWRDHHLGFYESTQLRHLDMSHNHINVMIDLANNAELEHLDLSYNSMEHEPTLQSHDRLQHYDVSHNNLLYENFSLLNNATRLTHYDISHNNIIGMTDFFPSLNNAGNLIFLDLSHNFFRFRDLEELSRLSNLRHLNMSYNRIDSEIPHSIEQLRALRVLNLAGNRLSGSLPHTMQMLTNLQQVYLSKNHLGIDCLDVLSGIPNLQRLYLDGNDMVGEIPVHITSLQHLQKLETGHNGLYATDPRVTDFLNLRDPDWAATQTVAPDNVVALPSLPDTMIIRWDPIVYGGGKGGYVVYYALSPAGPFTYYGMTGDKGADNLHVHGLETGLEYYFQIQTQSEPSARVPNQLISGDSETVSGEIPDSMPHAYQPPVPMS